MSDELSSQPLGCEKSAGWERRATVRYHFDPLSSYRPVEADPRHTCLGKVHDISSAGLGLLVSEKFDSGTLLHVEIKQTESNLARNLLVRVVHVAPAEPPWNWLVGCEILSQANPPDSDS